MKTLVLLYAIAGTTIQAITGLPFTAKLNLPNAEKVCTSKQWKNRLRKFKGK